MEAFTKAFTKAFSKARRLANVMTTGAGIPTASIQNDAITSDKIDDDDASKFSAVGSVHPQGLPSPTGA